MKFKLKKDERILARLKDMASFANKMEVGWVKPNEKHGGTKLNMAELAYVLIHGATITNKKTEKVITIPPRPVFKVTVDKKSKEWGKNAEELAAEILQGKTKQSTADALFGGQVADDMKAVIDDSSNWTPNRPSTVKRKGKNTPLIDTGSLRDAISYRIHGKMARRAEEK